MGWRGRMSVKRASAFPDEKVDYDKKRIIYANTEQKSRIWDLWAWTGFHVDHEENKDYIFNTQDWDAAQNVADNFERFIEAGGKLD